MSKEIANSGKLHETLTMAVGRFTYVLMNGITSAPLFGAVTMSTSFVSRRIV
jgi:hypothetical protein